MRMANWGRIKFVAGLIACGIFLPEINAFGQPERAPIHLPASVGVRYAGKPVRYRDLTLLNRQESEKQLNKVRAAYRNNASAALRTRWGSYMLGPMRATYQPGPRKGLRRIVLGAYRVGLNGAFYSFLHAKIIAAFCAKYSPKLGFYSQSQSVKKYLTAEAVCQQRQNDLFASCALGGVSGTAFASMYKRIFPRLPAEVPSAAYPCLRTGGFLYVLMDRCFPHLKGAKIAPWFAEEASPAQGLMTRPMVAAFRPEEPHLRRLIIRENGISNSVLIMHCSADDAAIAGKLVDACLRKGDKLSRTRFPRAILTMRLLGSPTVILPGHGNCRYYSRITGIPMGNITPLKLLPVRKQPGDFIYIYQKNPSLTPHAEKIYFTNKPGFPLFTSGAVAIMLPIVRGVLRKVEARSKFLRLPSATKLLYGSLPTAWGGGNTEYLGTPLPPLIPPQGLIPKP